MEAKQYNVNPADVIAAQREQLNDALYNVAVLRAALSSKEREIEELKKPKEETGP